MFTRHGQHSVVFIVLLTLLLTNCGKNDKPQEDSPEKTDSQQITIVETSRSFLNAPLYIAIEKGFLKGEQLNVTLETQQNFTQATDALNVNQVQFLVSPSDKIMYLYQQGLKNFLLMAQVSNSNGYFLLARNAGPFQVQDIKGKVIVGYRGGDLPYTLLYSELRKIGLRPFLSYHPVENLTYDSIPSVYRAGSGHFILAEEPLVSILEAEGLGQLLSTIELTNSPLPAHTVMVSKDFLNNNSATCRSLLRALQLSQAWLDQESPAEIAATLKPYFAEYSENALQRAAGRYKNVGCWGELQINAESFLLLQSIMLGETELRQTIPANLLLDSSLLK